MGRITKHYNEKELRTIDKKNFIDFFNFVIFTPYTILYTNKEINELIREKSRRDKEI